MEDGLDGATNEEQDAAVKEENKDEDEEDVDFGEEIEEDAPTSSGSKRTWKSPRRRRTHWRPSGTRSATGVSACCSNT